MAITGEERFQGSPVLVLRAGNVKVDTAGGSCKTAAGPVCVVAARSKAQRTNGYASLPRSLAPSIPASSRRFARASFATFCNRSQEGVGVSRRNDPRRKPPYAITEGKPPKQLLRPHEDRLATLDRSGARAPPPPSTVRGQNATKWSQECEKIGAARRLPPRREGVAEKS